MKYSIIVPVYNRPDEVDELLASLCNQKGAEELGVEVLIVEDGSQEPCKDVVSRYTERLDVHYLPKENGGPGPARNYGVEHARGDYVLILDSDVVLPDGYLVAVDNSLRLTPCDAFGGPDCAHPDFTDVQKAISYSMTSFFTTGGIRGGRKKLDKFYPRSFNMGIRRETYRLLGGFSRMRFGEDIDFSYRLVEAGFTTRLFTEAWVWHKRRTDFDKFFRQVFNSGIARINLEERHPGTLKWVHLLPAAFTIGVVLLIAAAVVLRLTFTTPGGPIPTWSWIIPLIPFVLYMLLIFVDAARVNRSAVIGFLSMKAAFVQLFGYGLGFLKAWWVRCVLKKEEFAAYEKTFYD